MSEERKETNKLPEITEKNIKFYRMIQSGISIIDAYKGAGYQGESPDAAYVLYNSLKKRLLALQEAESNIDSLRLRSQLSEILSLPLATKEISIKDKLNAIKLTHSIVEGTKSETSPSISAFIITPRKEQTDSLSNGPLRMDQADVIKAEVIETEQIKENGRDIIAGE